MEVIIRQGRYPGEWRLEFSTDNWEHPAIDMMAGMEPHFGDLYAAIWPWFGFEPNLRGALGPDLSAWNEMQARAQKRIDAGNPITEYDPDKMTGKVIISLLGEFLEMSNWWGTVTIERLSKHEYKKAMRALEHSVSWRVRFQTFLTIFNEEIDHPPLNGPAHALANRLDQVLKPKFISFCKDVVATGRAENIRQLNDLLDISGYDPMVTKISPRKLKEYANTAGIYFKPGRKKDT